MTINPELARLEHDARTRYGWASVAGAVARGELRPTSAERLDRLMVRMRRHHAAGRMQAAQAARRMVERLLAELEEGA